MSAGKPTDHLQTAGSGPNVTRFQFSGCGSAPSDPRRTYLIGNPGIRKSVKIRKIGKASFNLPIENHRLWTQSDRIHPTTLEKPAEEAHLHRTRPTTSFRQSLSDMFPPNFDSPPSGAGRTWSAGRRSHPMISFELTGPLTLETFTDHDGDGSIGGRDGVRKIAERTVQTVDN